MSEKWQHLDSATLQQFWTAYLDAPEQTAGPCCDYLEEQECQLSDVLLLLHAGKVGALVVAEWCDRLARTAATEKESRKYVSRALTVSGVWLEQRTAHGVSPAGPFPSPWYAGVGARIEQRSRKQVLSLFPDVTVTVRLRVANDRFDRIGMDGLNSALRDMRAAGFSLKLDKGFHPPSAVAHPVEGYADYTQTLPASKLTVAEDGRYDAEGHRLAGQALRRDIIDALGIPPEMVTDDSNYASLHSVVPPGQRPPRDTGRLRDSVEPPRPPG